METTPQPQQANTPTAPTKAAGNIFAAISYLPWLFLVTTFVKGKTDEFALWHAKRGAALTIIWIVFWALVSYVLVPILKIYFFVPLINLALLLGALFLAWKAWNNQKVIVPVLDKLAEKIPLEKLIGQSAPAASTAAPAANPAPTPSAAPAPVSTPVTNTVVEKKEEVMPPVQAEPVGGMSKPADAPVVTETTPAPAAAPANPAPVATPSPAAPAPAPAMPEAPVAPQAPATPATPTQNPPAQQ